MAMHDAARGGHLDCLVELMKAGSDIDAKDDVRLKRR